MVTHFPIGTLILPEPARTKAWHAWRAQLDLDKLSYACLQTMPALAPLLPQWLEADDCATRIQGCVKMAWSRNQIRLQRAAELCNALRHASVAPVALIGPLAWSLLTREEGAIRTIPDLTVLIPRQHLFTALSALVADGWELRRSQPDNDTLRWSSNLPFAKGEETLHLHWRLFPGASHEDASDVAAFDAAIVQGLRPTGWKGHRFQVLSPEADLLHRLMDRSEWDPVPWQADVLMTSFADIDWSRLRTLALRFAPFFTPTDPLERLMHLRRDWQLPIPEMALARRRNPRFTALLSNWGRHLWRA